MTNLFSDTKAAVAPTVAMSLFGLLAAGGLAFDYARIAGLDTELQQAADQAALAAATQLDRTSGAQERAENAIRDGDADNLLASNLTRFASFDAQNGPVITIDDITFCAEFDDTDPDTGAACTAPTGRNQAEIDADSRFVVVTTSVRTAPFALTPIVGLLSSDSIAATAVAGVEASICNIAPLLVCAPEVTFPDDDDVGKGLLLKPFGSGGSWAPGNYGLLDFGNGNNAVIDALLGFGLNGCQNTDDNETEPGTKNITDAINTRLDVYDGGPKTKDTTACKPATGEGCPAPNTRKDMVLEMTYTQTTARTVTTAPADNQACGASGGTVSYAQDFTSSSTPRTLGRDTCHNSGGCTEGNFGNGTWDRAAYFQANHASVSDPTGSIALGQAVAWAGKTATTLTRWNVYQWELASPSTRMGSRQTGTTAVTSRTQGQNRIWTYTKQCTFSQPKLAPTPYPAQKDRRVLPVVAADCTNLKGKGQAFEDYVLLRAFDVFITEPSVDRSAPPFPGASDNKEIYAEVLGPAETFNGGSGFQYYARSKPYLVR